MKGHKNFLKVIITVSYRKGESVQTNRCEIALRIAREKGISFSEVVRQAIDAYIEHEELLEAMVEMAIKANQESIEKVDALMKRMDETYAMLKERPRA